MKAKSSRVPPTRLETAARTPSRSATERGPGNRPGDHEAERRLAVLLAGTAAHRALRTIDIERLAGVADYEWLIATLDGLRLLPLLGGRLAEAAPEVVPDTLRDALAVSLRNSRRRAALVEQMSLQLMHALDAADIGVVALKGPHLAERLYGDAGMRTSNDIDLLVDPEDFHDAIRVLEGTGYRTAGRAPWRDGLPLFEASLRADDAWRPPIDLHWRLHWYERSYSRGFIRRCERDEHGVLLPRPLDELTALLLFWSRDGLRGLRHAADIGAWWDRHGGDRAPGALNEIATAHPALRPSLAAAALHAERVVGVPAHRLLSGLDGPGRRVRLAVRCASFASPWSQQDARASVVLTDALLTARGGGRALVERHFVLPRAVIADIYGLPPTARVRLGLRRVYFAARVGTPVARDSVAILRRACR